MARALLINPWIHDFAAYDLWVKPLGLLRLASLLRHQGIHVDLIDCLDPHHPSLCHRAVKRGVYGAGKFYKEEIPKPAALSWFPRRYSRYGLPPPAFDELIRKLREPDAILVTSGMTYWYPGVLETIAHCRQVFADVPVILGGIYPTLCRDHARGHSGADCIVPDSDWDSILASLSTYLPLSRSTIQKDVMPAWDLMPNTEGISVRISEGCPFHCTYCASKQLAPVYRAREPMDVVNEISWALLSTASHDVAFYDDALLWEAESHLMVILDLLRERGVSARFHDPNGLHARYLTQAVAGKMYQAGFLTIRLGLESGDPIFHETTGRKLQPEEFRLAVQALHRVGYRWSQIGAYVMAGLPGQTHQEVRDSMDYAFAVGSRPYLAEYSPIPGTALWDAAVQASPFPLQEEPLFHNNTLLPCRWSGFDYHDLLNLKSALREEALSRMARQ